MAKSNVTQSFGIVKMNKNLKMVFLHLSIAVMAALFFSCAPFPPKIIQVIHWNVNYDVSDSDACALAAILYKRGLQSEGFTEFRSIETPGHVALAVRDRQGNWWKLDQRKDFVYPYK